MAAYWARRGPVLGIRGAGIQSSDPRDHRARPHGCRRVPARGVVLRKAIESRLLATFKVLPADRRTCLRRVFCAGAFVQLVPIWLVHADIYSNLRSRDAGAGSHSPGEFSLEHAAARRRDGCALSAGKIHFLIRSSADPGSASLCPALETA